MGNKLAFFSLLVLFLACVLALPVIYPTTTLWYKYNIDKILLYSGQYAGMLACFCIYVQIALGTRGRFLDKTFGPGVLINWHRKLGVFIGVLGLSHLLLILLPEGLDNLPIGVKYWPEMVGFFLFVSVIILIASGIFRQAIKMPYKAWKVVHRFFAYLCFVLLHIHLLFVSDTFDKNVPKLFVFVVLLLFIPTLATMVRSKKK